VKADVGGHTEPLAPRPPPLSASLHIPTPLLGPIQSTHWYTGRVPTPFRPTLRCLPPILNDPTLPRNPNLTPLAQCHCAWCPPP